MNPHDGSVDPHITRIMGRPYGLHVGPHMGSAGAHDEPIPHAAALERSIKTLERDVGSFARRLSPRRSWTRKKTRVLLPWGPAATPVTRRQDAARPRRRPTRVRSLCRVVGSVASTKHGTGASTSPQTAHSACHRSMALLLFEIRHFEILLLPQVGVSVLPGLGGHYFSSFGPI
jgi:hypothetical protein